MPPVAALSSSPTQFVAWHVVSLRAFGRPCASGAYLAELGIPRRQQISRRPHQQLLVAAAAQPEQGQEWAADSTPPALQVRRALGLDYGRRVVGLAVSTMGLAPRPLEGLPGPAANEQLQCAAAALEVARREACDAIVVGLPVTQAGSLRQRATDSQQGRRCRQFAGNMAAVAASAGLRVFLADERGSTMEAKEALAFSGSRKSMVSKRKDSVAAAVILASFFDDPAAAVLVKPWRPAGSGSGEQQAQQAGGQQQPQALQPPEVRQRPAQQQQPQQQQQQQRPHASRSAQQHLQPVQLPKPIFKAAAAAANSQQHDAPQAA